MANFYVVPGSYLKATEDHISTCSKHKIVKGAVVQLLNIRWNFTFVNNPGVYSKTGKGWEKYD